MSDTNDATLHIVPETVAGVTPATPAFKTLRITGETLVANFESQVSNELSPNSDVLDVKKTGLSTSGDINFELHRDANLEDMIAAALRGAWATDVLKAATLKPSFTIERKIASDTDSYLRFDGSHFNGISLSIDPGEIITGSGRVTGMGHVVDTAIVAGATYTAPTGAATAPPMTGTDVSAVTASGVTGVDFSQMTIEIDNNNRVQKKLASVGGKARGIGYGRRSVTGTLVSYFETLAHYEQFINDESPSLTATMSDGTNSFTIVMPKVKFTGGEAPISGIDQDIMLTLQWQAVYDTVTGTTIQITRA